jgi:hypothetical protein
LFTWLFPTADGTYTIAARAYDANGNQGTLSTLQITLNRHQAIAPTSLTAGWNAQINGVDIQWVPSGTQTYATTSNTYRVVGVDTDPSTQTARASTAQSPSMDANLCDHPPNAPSNLKGTVSGGAMILNTGAERVRYCIPTDTATGNPNDEVLISQTQTWTTATPPAIPWSTTCPDTSSSQAIVLPSVTNRYQGTDRAAAFTYNDQTVPPTDLTTITTVQIDMFVNPTPTVTNAETELRTGVYVRNQIRFPVANIAPTDTGGGGVLLNGGTSHSPDGESLSYSWSCTSAQCPSSSTLSNTKTGWSTGCRARGHTRCSSP